MNGRLGLTEEHRRQMIDHCVESLPFEGCGLLAVSEDEILAVYPTANADHSPVAYTVPPGEHYEAVMDAESRGWEINGVFHSHPQGPPVLSLTDLEELVHPSWLYVVIGLADRPTLRAWRHGHEVEL